MRGGVRLFNTLGQVRLGYIGNAVASWYITTLMYTNLFFKIMVLGLSA